MSAYDFANHPLSAYETLVMQAQEVYSRNYFVYARGGSPYRLDKSAPLDSTAGGAELARLIREADHVVVGGASGLSASGGGDFYYGDTPSFRKHFGKFAEKYGIRGAFDGIQYDWPTNEERWGYIATFLHTTQTAPVREPYLLLRELLTDKDYFVITTNQDTQAVKAFPEERVAQIQGDHRFFQCSQCCTDDVWDAVEPVNRMIEAMGDGTSVPTELIPRCPHCGAEAFPWVRGYGNLLEGTRYQQEYQKASDYLAGIKGERTLYLELGVGRLTPMFIQEPFWMLTASNPRATYVTVNAKNPLAPRELSGRALKVEGDITQALRVATEAARKAATEDPGKGAVGSGKEEACRA